MTDLFFANSEYLICLLAIPLFVIFYILIKIQKNKAIKTFGNEQVIRSLMPEYSKGRNNFKFILIMLVYTFIVLAIARPQVGAVLKESKVQGGEIIVALDVSNSMLAKDIYPNRMEKAKTSIIKLLDKFYTDKIGVIIFAGEASTQVPMTNDYNASQQFIKSIDHSFVKIQGTAIGAAINLAVNSFSPNNDKSRAIIVISDGENHEDDAVTAAENAYKAGIVVYTIGIGSEAGEPIPDENSNNNLKKDKQGNIVMTKLNEEMLKKIAKAGNGTYVKASNTDIGLNYIYDEIQKIAKGEIAVFASYDDKYHYFIFAALILLIIDFFTLERKNRWLSKLKIFQ